MAAWPGRLPAPPGPEENRRDDRLSSGSPAAGDRGRGRRRRADPDPSLQPGPVSRDRLGRDGFPARGGQAEPVALAVSRPLAARPADGRRGAVRTGRGPAVSAVGCRRRRGGRRPGACDRRHRQQHEHGPDPAGRHDAPRRRQGPRPGLPGRSPGRQPGDGDPALRPGRQLQPRPAPDAGRRGRGDRGDSLPGSRRHRRPGPRAGRPSRGAGPGAGCQTDRVHRRPAGRRLARRCAGLARP